MTIDRMTKGRWGNILAFFDLKTDDGFLITGMKVINGVNGRFVGFPSKLDEQEAKYSEIVRAGKETRERVEKLALEFFDKQTDEAFNNIPSALSEDKETDTIF